MIIAIANENDGAEKSILASSLAALRALASRKVLLIDADPCKLSLTWSSKRDDAGVRPKVSACAISGKGLQPELENLIPRYDDIVIDTEARDCLASRSALVAARIVIIPVRAGQIDQANQQKLIKRLETARIFNPRLRVLFVITCAHTSPSMEDFVAARAFAAKIALAKLADTVIHERTALHEAFDRGRCISEYKPIDEHAIAGMTYFYREVFADEKTRSSAVFGKFHIAHGMN
jgi:chromosome partitioning protein